MLPGLILHFGYAAVLVGTFLEGETILVLAGFAAHRGYLQLPLVILAAFFGTTLGDQLFYFLGRNRHEALLNKRPGWHERVKRVERLIQQYRIPLLLGFRFLYGLRTITPFTFGMVGISPRLFIPFNILGAALWSLVFGYAGYCFGNLLETLLGQIKRYELLLSLVVAGVGGLVWIVYFYRRKRS